MAYSTRALAAYALIAGSLTTRAASAQAADPNPGPTAECSYSACALTIAPRWNGLAVVRGMDARPIANLNFFWPRDVSSALVSSASTTTDRQARDAAARAVHLRRIGAVLTDGGAILLASAAVRAASAGQPQRRDYFIAGVGAGAFVLSVPFQFAADGMLSRAVWWHNARYSR